MSTLSVVLLLVLGVFGDTDDGMSVMEGDSVTLHTDIQNVQKITWTVAEGNASIFLVDIDGNKISYVEDERLRDRLQIQSQTGDLTMMNMRIKHSGFYQAKIVTHTETYKNFTVTVNESPRVLDADTCDVKSVSVMEGCSVTLNTDVQTQRDHLMLWRFGDEGLLIAKVDKEDNKSFIYDDGLDGIFKDRLQLNDQTGDVIITNARIVDTGLYQLKITSNKNKTSYKTFSVYVKGTHFSVVVVVTYFVLLLLCVLVLLAIAVYQSHHESSGLRQIKASCKSTGNKRGIRAVVFHCVLKMLLVMLVLMLSVVTYSYIMTLDLEKIDDKSSTTLAVVLGVLQMMLFLAANIVFQRISQQKQRGICLGVLHLLLLMLLMLIVAIYTIGFVDLKQLEGHMSKIYIILLVLMVLGVIHYFSESFYLKLIKVQKMPVFEGESVFLPTGVSELQSDDVIQLSFENQVIVKFNKANRISSDDERFRDRLLVDDQTGSLIIRNMRADDTGLYKVKMSSNSQVKSFLEFITGEGPTYSQFNVIGIRENESLMVVKSLLNEAEDDV